VFSQQIVVAAKIDALHAEAAAERLARSGKPASPNRIASALKSVWSSVSGPAERPLELPRLNDYPFRS
jgi:hypothetical protein